MQRATAATEAALSATPPQGVVEGSVTDPAMAQLAEEAAAINSEPFADSAKQQGSTNRPCY